MADTGAPWNLPYPLPTDLVRDGADAIKDLAEATADGLDAAGSPGIGPNVVQALMTNVLTGTIAFEGEVGIADLQVTITPSSDTSKVLLIAGISTSISTQVGWFLKRGTTEIGTADAVGLRKTTASGTVSVFSSDGDVNRSSNTSVIVLLDSPGAATATTYQVFGKGNRNADLPSFYQLNRADLDNDTKQTNRFVSSLIAIEVAA